MQIKLNLEEDSQLLEINKGLNLEKHREILPKHIQINGRLILDRVDEILSSIDSSILSFGRINVKIRSLEDFH